MDWRLALAGLQLQLEGLRQAGWRDDGGLSPPRPPIIQGPSQNSLRSISPHQPWSNVLSLLHHHPLLPPPSVSTLGLTSNHAVHHDIGSPITGAFQSKKVTSVQPPTLGPISAGSFNWRDQLDHLHAAMLPAPVAPPEGDLRPSTGQKQGKWCAMHVRIAWEIHLTRLHQQQDQGHTVRQATGRLVDGKETSAARRQFNNGSNHSDSNGTSGSHVNKVRSSNVRLGKGAMSSLLRHLPITSGVEIPTSVLPFLDTDLLSTGPIPPPPQGQGLTSPFLELSRQSDVHPRTAAGIAAPAVEPSVTLPTGWIGHVPGSRADVGSGADRTGCQKDVSRKRKKTNERASPQVSLSDHIAISSAADGIMDTMAMTTSTSIAVSSSLNCQSDSLKYRHLSALSPTLGSPDSTVSTSSSDDLIVTLPLIYGQRTVKRKDVTGEHGNITSIQSSPSRPSPPLVDTSPDSINRHQLWNPFLQSTIGISKSSRQHLAVDVRNKICNFEDQVPVRTRPTTNQREEQRGQNPESKMKSIKKIKLEPTNISQSQVISIREEVATTGDVEFQTPSSPEDNIVNDQLKCSQSPSKSTIDILMTSTKIIAQVPLDERPSACTAGIKESVNVTRPHATYTPDSSSTCRADDRVAIEDQSLDPVSKVNEDDTPTTDCIKTAANNIAVVNMVSTFT